MGAALVSGAWNISQAFASGTATAETIWLTFKELKVLGLSLQILWREETESVILHRGDPQGHEWRRSQDRLRRKTPKERTPSRTLVLPGDQGRGLDI